MPSLSDLKTTNPAWWQYPRAGVPAWLLSNPINAWNTLIDILIAALASIVPYSPADITTPVAPGLSPWTYTAGSGPEILYISGGSVNSIKKNGTVLTQAATVTVILAPTKSVVIDYNSAPYVAVDR